MAVTLVSNPVSSDGGIIKNVFAGFSPVEFEFKREDLQISTISAGSDNKVRISLSSSLSDYLEEGDAVYFYGVGDNYTYDSSGEVLTVTDYYIDIDVEFIETINSGYINYKQNYYLEVELISTLNEAASILPFTMRDDGDSQGNIIIDVGIASDYTQRTFDFSLSELTEARTQFKLKYREVYREDTESYTTIGNQIIVYYATEQADEEEFIQELDEAYIYEGYPFGATALHSDQNTDDAGFIEFTYDELDINSDYVTAGTSLGVLDSSKYGQLFVNLSNEISLDESTEYIQINGTFSESVAFFDPSFFDQSFFDVD